MADSVDMEIIKEETSIKLKQKIKKIAFSEQIDFRVTKYDLISNVVSILFRLITLLANINLAHEYYSKAEYLYFKLTITFILVPALISTLLSITIHIEDSKLEEEGTEKKQLWKILFFVIIFPYTLRFLQSLIYQIKSKRAEKRKDYENQRLYFRLMIKEESDVALVRIVECFLDNSAHKIIHMTAVLQSGIHPTTSQLLFLISAFTGFAWSMTAYSKSIRLAQPDKRKLSIAGIACQCVWHFCVTFARVISIVLVCALFPIPTIIAIIIHAFLMTLWIFIIDRPPFCSYTCVHSFGFSIIFGAVFIFTYLLPKETKSSFWRYFFFYSLTGIENVACITIFLLFSAFSKNINYVLSATPIISFILGILAMTVYYKYLHPNILSRKLLLPNE